MTRQDTINCEIDKVEGTCGRAYISGITYSATSDNDACTIGIFLLRSDLTHNHGVENFFSSVLRDIFKSNDAEGVCALHAFIIGAFSSFSDSLAYSDKFIGIGYVSCVRKLWVLAELSVL